MSNEQSKVTQQVQATEVRVGDVVAPFSAVGAPFIVEATRTEDNGHTVRVILTGTDADGVHGEWAVTVGVKSMPNYSARPVRVIR